MRSIIRIETCIFSILFILAALPCPADEPVYPSPTSNLQLKAPITTWDEAIPLGNGLLGGLLWGDDQTLRLSLDRGDLWESRSPEIIQQPDWTWETIRRLVAEKNQGEISRLFDTPYNQFRYPTKIPAGRIEWSAAAKFTPQRFSLDLARAIGIVEGPQGRVEVFYSAARPVAMIRLTGIDLQHRIVPAGSVAALGYPAAEIGGEGDVAWTLQKTTGPLAYAVVTARKQKGDTIEIAVAVAATLDGTEDPVALGHQRTAEALETGYDVLLKEHLGWWQTFWDRSSVVVPEPTIQRHYDLVQYFYGAASRRGAPPMPLQGVWTADAGLPPWHGDYHHDTNTQMTYWAYLTSGRFDEGASFLDFMWDLLPRHRRFAREFYGTSGAAVPGVMTLDGSPMGGWSQYSLSPTMGPWVAQAFYLHWRYTMDDRFLRERAYPYCRELAESLVELLQEGDDGRLHLPLSSSPEIYNNSLRAWVTPDSNFDLSLMHWFFAALEEMAQAQGDAAAAAHWRGILDRLAPLAVDEENRLLIAPGDLLSGSHRHHSHLMAIHPLGTLHVEGTPRDRAIIEASLEHWRKLGTSGWVGFAFSWAACIEARAGNADEALKNLRIFVQAFISRNGFNLNGDQTGSGYSNFRYRPFTLEANFAASQAVHEMLLQSWGGRVRIFPAVPDQWTSAEFKNWRAEGGFVVSARRENGQTVEVTIRATVDQPLRLRDPFGGRAVQWNLPGVEKQGNDYVCELKAGQQLHAAAP